MNRIVLGVEYDGSQFHGWQRQNKLRTIQAEVETALSTVADEPIATLCAGRTDAGVHAKGQVIHFDTYAKRGARAWVFGTNTHLPKDIAITWAKETTSDFHARFSATGRHYRYLIYNRPMHPTYLRHYVTWYPKPLNVQNMHTAAQYLLGEQDFSSFRDADCQSKSPMRNVFSISVKRQAKLISLDVYANAFLHHMVRNIAGALLDIGSGAKPIPWIQDILAAKDRKAASITAKPSGLYLMRVQYVDLPSTGQP